ncbi:MAG TPA: TonB-dependent receptor [Gemmatimonadales bacterium]|jgi:hypothetical protein
MSARRVPASTGLLALMGLIVLSSPLLAQADGAVAGRVREYGEERSLGGAQVLLDGVLGAVADTAGLYRIRGVRSGWHRVSARLIGYRSVVLDSVFVRAAATVVVNFALQPNPLQLEPLVVTAPVDEVLDPLVTSTEQKITAADLRDLPVSSLEEALTLSAGSVGQSYRGGRIGEESFILDGLGVKNQLDASSGGLGLHIPPDMLSEASLVTNGFSARYGQALSGLVNVVTLEPDTNWTGRVAYETDRPFGGELDRGLDRVAGRAGGPIAGGVGLVAAVDLTGRLDGDPVNAPAPDNPLDPRVAEPYPLPHNSLEQWNGAAKLVLPITHRATVRLLGLHSEDQQLLYDPAYKYDLSFAPAQRLKGDLFTGHIHWSSDPGRGAPLLIDLRVGRFSREFLRGTLDREVDYKVGAFTTSRFHFLGEDIARNQVNSPDPIPGFSEPDFSLSTPYGVPAVFLGTASRGDLGWNHFGETRIQLDATYGFRQVDLFAGGDFAAQQVRTYQRVLAYLPAGAGVPGPAISAFSPTHASAYVEAQGRFADLALTAGLRYDQFDGGSSLPTESRGAQRNVSPRFAASTVLRGATVVVSYGRFSQAPDYQFLVDAAFDDTTRTGRFRRGNADVGFEKASQFEFSVRRRITEAVWMRLGAYSKRLTGLVASVPLGVNPDSTIFGNADAGSVKGLELLVDRELRGGFGFRVAYTLQKAQATSTDPFLLTRVTSVDPVTGDTVHPPRAEFPLDFDRSHSLTVIARGRVPGDAGPRFLGVRPIGGLEAAAIFRANSGLPFTRTAENGDTVGGLPNNARLPWTTTLDLLVRRPLRLGGVEGGIYLDIRNLLDRRNIIAVRRETGGPQAAPETIDSLAEADYQAHPETIPYESARYRAGADLNHDGYLEGHDELFPLYRAAEADFAQPLFTYGPPRLARLGVELLF